MATVVIVGGGIGGSLLAKCLQDHCKVVLIDPKEYLEIIYGELRSMVEPSFANKSVISHFEYIPKVRSIVSTAVKVTENEVFTANGLSVAYDYLVIATGHLHTGERTRSDRLKHYEAEHQRIKSCNSILIVGGGPTGVELAAEISTDYPEKKITLVSRGTRLLEFIGEKASKKTLKWLISKNVRVILGQYVDITPVSIGVYKTSGGETIQADGVFKCLGLPLASKWLKDTFLESRLDDQGRLMVDGNLRIKGYKNVFAIGDITDIPELKQGFIAHEHAKVAAKNLKLLMSGSSKVTFSVLNKCTHTIWPGILGNTRLETTGFKLPPGDSRSIEGPSGWSGRFWARTDCTFHSDLGQRNCTTGDCGSNQVECNGSGASPPVTLAEFTVGSDTLDFYDVSLVNGYNLPMIVEAIGSSPCSPTGCVANLNKICPQELRDSSGQACMSACDAFKNPQYCCNDAYGTPDTCRPSIYSLMFKNVCPRSYTYAYDDATSTFTCTAMEYKITFCPSMTSQKSSKGVPSPRITIGSQTDSGDDFISWFSNFVNTTPENSLSFNILSTVVMSFIVFLLSY